MTEKPIWEFSPSAKGKFKVKFPYDAAAKDALKAAGGRWYPAGQAWVFVLDMPTISRVTDIGKQFNCKFDIDPTLKAWVQAERKRIANIVAVDDISQANDSLLPRVKEAMPSLWKSLSGRPFQLLGAHFMAQTKNVLMADQPGMGKTIQTLAAIVENDVRGPILVVAPRTAVNVTWPAEIKRWLGPDEVIYVINGAIKPAERKMVLDAAYRYSHGTGKNNRVWVLCGPNYLRIRADLTTDGMRYIRDANGDKIIRVVNEGRPELFQFVWSAVIVDESHQTLAGATGNIKKQSAQRQGLGALRVKDNGMRMALSGTPFRGKSHYMWGQIDWINPEGRLAYWQWINRHFGTETTRFGMTINEKIKDEAAFYQELKPMMVRRTKTEVIKDLPPKMYGGEPLDPNDSESPIAVWLDMTPKQARQYNVMESSALLQIANQPDMPVNGILAEMIRLKQIANSVVTLKNGDIVDNTVDSNKMNWILDFVEERTDAGTKVIVASQFTKFIYALSKHLGENGFEHYLLTGRQNDRERTEAQNAFQSENGHGIFLLNTKAGGVSLTLDRADDVVIVDSTFNPDDQEQVEDRAHRVSRMHNVTIWNLCSRNTIDEHIAKLTAERESDTKGVIDGQRGIQFTKRIAESVRKTAIEQKGKKTA